MFSYSQNPRVLYRTLCDHLVHVRSIVFDRMLCIWSALAITPTHVPNWWEYVPSQQKVALVCARKTWYLLQVKNIFIIIIIIYYIYLSPENRGSLDNYHLV